MEMDKEIKDMALYLTVETFKKWAKNYIDDEDTMEVVNQLTQEIGIKENSKLSYLFTGFVGGMNTATNTLLNDRDTRPMLNNKRIRAKIKDVHKRIKEAREKGDVEAVARWGDVLTGLQYAVDDLKDVELF